MSVERRMLKKSNFGSPGILVNYKKLFLKDSHEITKIVLYPRNAGK